MATNKKGLIAKLKHSAALAKVRKLCQDKTDAERYERLVEDEDFLSVEANRAAFMQVIVEDYELWGGDLKSVFIATESDSDFTFGFGVTTAYNSLIELLACGIRERNPVIAWIRHFFETRTSSTQKVDAYCLYALVKSLLLLYNEEDIDDLYDAAEAVKAIPCEAWGNFIEGFYPYYEDFIDNYSLDNVLEM